MTSVSGPAPAPVAPIRASRDPGRRSDGKAVRVGKGLQLLVLASYSAAVLVLTLLVEGPRNPGANLAPFQDVERLVARARAGEFLTSRFLLALGGIAGNLLLFFPFGFLAFKYLDSSGRGTARIHVDVLLSAFFFSAGTELVQSFLPTRAADVDDVLWNILGAALGTAAAHVAREFRLDWERS